MAEQLDYAIIGAGVSGCYAAWRLKQHYPEAKLALFENSDRIGGRLYSRYLPGMPHVTAELGGIHAPPNYRRSHMLGPIARKILPDLNIEGGAEWMGYRPSMPDSLPVIGRAPGTDRTVLAFGHGHSGLTMAGITGRLVADLIAGRDSEIDITPYRPDRFGGDFL